MNLYEVTNKYIGESYVRCYVWAADEYGAYQLAQARYIEKYGMGKRESITLHAELLFNSDDPAFVTMVSDSGWEKPE